mgnify:CR=1 FL=1
MFILFWRTFGDDRHYSAAKLPIICLPACIFCGLLFKMNNKLTFIDLTTLQCLRLPTSDFGQNYLGDFFFSRFCDVFLAHLPSAFRTPVSCQFPPSAMPALCTLFSFLLSEFVKIGKNRYDYTQSWRISSRI